MILEKIIKAKKQEVIEQKQAFPLSLLEKQLPNFSGDIKFKNALSNKALSLIAEIKKASPSKGILNNDLDVVKTAKIYEKAGAVAISVLTEKIFFQGCCDDLRDVKNNVSIPILRKDFIIDTYQIYESKFIGADAVLLIAAALNAENLQNYISLCKELQLAALVEIHDEQELEKALRAGAEIVGINNRNLNTFSTDISVTLRFASLIPRQYLLISESGIKNKEDIEKLCQAGADAVLIGEALVCSKNIEKKICELFEGYGR